jgi:hypothetical protein
MYDIKTVVCFAVAMLFLILVIALKNCYFELLIQGIADFLY